MGYENKNPKKSGPVGNLVFGLAVLVIYFLAFVSLWITKGWTWATRPFARRGLHQ